jgi:outer membrane protein assembly factor BamB
MEITRRDILKSGAAASMAPLAKYASALPSLAPPSFSFAFFSDTHVSIKRNVEECRSMLQEMKDLPFDFAVNGGDVTEAGWGVEVDSYVPLLKEVPFKIHHIPGNHDVRWSPLGPKIFEEQLGPMHSSFGHKGLHFVLLDSSVPLEHWGHFESEQLRWLEEDLKKVGRETPVMVFTHHWIGREGVMADNEEELLRVLEPYNVKMVFNAHGHSDLLWTWDGLNNTMNKGLYQLSWQRVDVDQEKGEVRVSRRTKEKPEQTHLISIPLKSGREKRRVYNLPKALTAGQVLKLPEGSFEARWDDGKFEPIPAEGLTTAGLVSGTHRLSLRTNKRTYFRAGTAQVETPNNALKPMWQRKLSGGVMSHLRLAEGLLYVSAMDGSLHAMNPANGKKAWSAEVGGYCHSSPTIVGDQVYVGSSNGNLYAFNSKSGKQLWKATTNGPVYASAAEARGIVCVGSGDGVIYGFDRATGVVRWHYEQPKHNAAFSQSPVATDGERFFIGAWDNKVYALNAVTGDLVWSQLCCERTFAYSPAIGNPIYSNGKVFVPANGNVLFCFDAVNGDPQWQVSSKGDKYGYSSPIVEGDRLYTGTLGDKGEVRCISVADGSEIWVAATGSTIYDSGPALGDGWLAIGSVSGLVSVISKSDGKVLGGYVMPKGHLLATPVAEGNRVWVGSYSDYVMGFEVRV